MNATLVPEVRGLLEAPNFGHLATTMPDGSPQVSPVWVDVDGDDVIVNSAEGRIKVNNMRRDPRVAISIADAETPYQAALIRGRVIEATTGDEAERHIDGLAGKYLGQDTYPFRRPGEVRVKIRIKPERVSTVGG